MTYRAIALWPLLLAPALARAQPAPGPYVSLGAGVNLQQNEIVTPAPALGFNENVIYTFHPGFAGQASAGWQLPFHLRAEIEGDYIDNVVRGAQATLLSGDSPPRRAGGTEQKYGGFLNVIYDLDLGLPVQPYFGVGAGGQEVERHDFNQNIQGVVALPPPPGTRLGYGRQTVGAFAYQGIAGVSVPISWLPGLSFTADYRFIGLLDPQPALTLTTQRRILVLAPPPLLFAHYERVAVTGNRHFTNDFNHTILLGFRYALFQPPPPPPPAPPAPPPPAPVQEARTYLVFFDWDRADLSQRARQIVSEAAQASQHVQTTRIEVNGYTDLSGTAAYNLKLSVRRAKSVQAELVRDGVSPSEIEIHGYGESNPLVPTAKGVREPQNRRVEIILQ